MAMGRGTMNRLSRMAATALGRSSADPAIEFDGRWYSWAGVRSFADQVTALIEGAEGKATAPIGFIARNRPPRSPLSCL
jgi:long-chain acyl-CoA synthetase